MVKKEKRGLVNVAGDEGGVCAPQGFAASGVIVGIKVSGNPDMALTVNQGPEKTAATVFTTNRVQVVSVAVSKKHVADDRLSTVVLSSNNTSACNDQPGIADALEVCRKVADELGVDVTEAGTCSTGLISDRLPMDIVLTGISKLCENLDSDAAAGTVAAGAVLITNLVARQAVMYGDGFTVSAVGKDVGMVSPLMATILGMITTDVSVSIEMTHETIAKASEVTFNYLDIDGSASTSDTITILANGASGVEPSQEEFDQAVLSVCNSITRQVQSDTEGVTKCVSVAVRSTGDAEDALVAARIIGRDNLFKCAMFDSGPNQGRVPATVGIAPVDIDPERITVFFSGHVVCRDIDGTPDTREVNLSGKDVAVEVDLGTGSPEEAAIRTTDLSHNYIYINSVYSSQRLRGDSAMVHQLTEGLSFEQQAYVLVGALPWLQHHRDRIMVVKCGGNAVANLKLKKTFAQDMVFLHTVGVKPVVIRGGDPQISSILKRLRLEEEFQSGFRVTTSEVIKIVRMVLFGQVGHELVNLINAYGPYAVGTSGEDGGLFTGTRRTVNVGGKKTNIGLVGNITKVCPETLSDLIDAGRTPAVSMVAPSADGREVYGISTDTAVDALASAINADRLAILTNVEDLYTDWPNCDSLVSRISTSHLREVLPTLDSGMIPKMESCLNVVDQGVPAARVIGGRQPHSVLLELVTSGGISTMVEPGQGGEGWQEFSYTC